MVEKTKHDYGFPYKPYDVQIQLMNEIYGLLKADKKIGLFESPTGTGKTMSLICSIFTWYLGRDPQQSSMPAGKQVVQTDDDFLSMFGAPTQSEQKPPLDIHKKRVYKALNSTDIKEVQMRLKQKREMRPNTGKTDSHILNYDSENEKKDKKLKEISRMAKQLQFGGNQTADSASKDRQVIFCTRTHSQISQIVGEIRRTDFSDHLTVVPIVSRKGLCVNEQVIKDQPSEKPHDIEEISKNSNESKICGYFGSRSAAKEADILITPYQSILSESTRESLGISLNNKVLVFDEAHNIMETITSMNSVSIRLFQLQQGSQAIEKYLEKYGQRLAAKNKKSLKDIMGVSNALIKYLEGKKEQADVAPVEVMELLIDTDLYKLDFVHISEFFEKADLVRKVNGFIQSQLDQQQKKTDCRSILYAIKEFIRALSQRPGDGKFIIAADSIKYLCLNPTTTLKRMLDEVRAIIFISGTLEPSQEFNLLLKHVDQDQVSRFNCDHIIPKQHFQGVIVPTLSGKPFDFRYQSRGNTDQMSMMSQLLLTICHKTPSSGGIIVFLQSYTYKEQFLTFLRESSFFKDISEIRKIFEESKDGPDVFPLYQRSIQVQKQSSLLFCIIGGKLSEGINFSDDLARTLVVFGLPFPNSQSIEIKEKMRYFDRPEGDAQFRGQDYYENLCMRTLNQAVGRAIRHARDYATIVLVDQRFSQAGIQKKLPRWIQSRLTTQEKGDIEGVLTQFFKYFS